MGGILKHTGGQSTLDRGSKLPDHPTANGVQPFAVNDEWYFHMRFPEDMKGVTPFSQPSYLPRPWSDLMDHTSSPAVREAVAKGLPQHVAWAFDRPDGGRGFGFTGLHNHLNWRNPNFRKGRSQCRSMAG